LLVTKREKRLSNFCFNSVIRDSLRNSAQVASQLFTALDQYAPRLKDNEPAPDWSEVVPQWEITSLKTTFNRFETVLTAELQSSSLYFVTAKRGYDTLLLTETGEVLFPKDLPAKVSNATTDARAAARCLAFELNTAAAFHIYRVVEAVLRRYWEVITGNQPKPKTRSIGVFLSAMKKLDCGSPKIISAMYQLNNLHRNPTIHPEDHLTTDEAVSLFGIANSLVGSMLAEIPAEETTPVIPGLIQA
jgi:hypothetical protein